MDIDGKKTGGRQKGTPNKDNELKKFLIDLVNNGQQKLIDELETLNSKDYVDAVFKLMEYVQPKLSRAEVKTEIKIDESIDLSKYSTTDLKDAIKSNKRTDTSGAI